MIPAMNIERGIFEEIDPEAEAASIARARADIAAGRVISHKNMVAWLKTWGTEDRKPLPREWLR